MEKYNHHTDAESSAASETLLHERHVENYIQPREGHGFCRRNVVLHFSFFLLYSVIGVTLFLSSTPRCQCDLVYSPAQEAVNRYSVVGFNDDLYGGSVYSGTPRAELHTAWRQLLQYNNIRVPESDLRKINRTSVPLNDKNGGFLVTLEVFHHLHCLNQLRKHAYYEYYYPDINKWNSTTRFIHVNHCIENLRRVLMCQADVSLVTYKWIDNHRRPVSEFDVDHTCRDWESLMSWASEQNIPSLKGSILLHPQLGPSWPEGEDYDLM